MPPLTALVIRLVSRRLRRLSHSLQDSVGDLTRVVQESINSNREIRIFGGSDYERGRFGNFNNLIRRYHMKVTTASEAHVVLVQMLTVIALSLVIYFASRQSLAGQLSVGEFVSLITALASRGWSPSRRRRKPAACSNALGPRRGTLVSCFREVNGPFSFLKVTIFLASWGPRPDT